MTIFYQEVDKIIDEEYRQGNMMPSIYILNPTRLVRDGYAYSAANNTSVPLS